MARLPRVLVLLLLAVLAPLALGACDDDPPTGGEVTAEDLADAPEDDVVAPERGGEDTLVIDPDDFQTNQLLGQTVTITSDVTEVYSPTFFEIETGEGPILVTSALDSEVDEGDTVVVTGLVQEFDPNYQSGPRGGEEGIESENRPGERQQMDVERFEGRTMIAAEEVEVV